jgi:hypothetical protein
MSSITTHVTLTTAHPEFRVTCFLMCTDNSDGPALQRIIFRFHFPPLGCNVVTFLMWDGSESSS